MNEYEYMQKRKNLMLGAIGFVAFCFVANAVKADDTTVRDHYKNIIHKKPYSVEVCYDQQVSGDKSSDMITGAIIGGIIGNNVTKNLPDGGTAGAIIGGLLGHQNSNASGEHELYVRWKDDTKKSHKLSIHIARLFLHTRVNNII